ncbi:hypothetical protein MMC12_006036 [Toensbergia leucococca]|nr:hypothetical protein [Toensbergia leucococca]
MDDNRGPEFLAIFGTGTAIATVLVSLRLWVRSRIVRKVGLDDWIIAASMIIALGALGCLATSVHYGLGRHTAFLTPEQSKTALKLMWVSFCIIPCAEATAKISGSLMLIRITTSAKWKWFFYTLIVLIIFMTIIKVFAILFSCRPIGRLWDASLEGHCDVAERTIVIYIQGVMAALYDVTLATSPIFLLWNVQISRYTKVLLCGLLGLCFFTSAAGIVRTTYTSESSQTEDVTYVVMKFLIWKTVELPLSIIVGCLPTLRPLFNQARLNRERAPRKQDDTYILTDQQSGDRIRKTTTISIKTLDPASGDPSFTSNIWNFDGRVV